MTLRSKDDRWRDLLVALTVGSAGAALLWLAGADDAMPLAYVAAAMAYAGNRARCSLRRRRTRGEGWPS